VEFNFSRCSNNKQKNSLGYTIFKAGLCFRSSFHAALDPFCNGIRSHHGGNETDTSLYNNILDEALTLLNKGIFVGNLGGNLARSFFRHPICWYHHFLVHQQSHTKVEVAIYLHSISP
jgi:hypothetical protein